MTQKTSTENLFKTLQIKPNAQLVLDYLIKHGLSPVKDIAHSLNIPKSTVYDSLDELVTQSLVIEYSEERGRIFGIADKEQIAKISEQKIKELQDNQNKLIEYIKNTEREDPTSKPKIKFYFGKEGIKQAFRDTMWNEKCKQTYLMWSTKDMLDILGPEFSEWHSSMRLRHKIVLNVIRKKEDKKFDKTEGLKEGWNSFRDIRQAPKNIDWNMSYWIYDNRVLFSGGGSDKFAFVVHDKEFANLMTTLWKQVWEISEK
jgi:sugar-specific transcriptional regulator TrmB